MFRAAPARRPGTLLRAVGALTTPLLPEDFLGLVDPLWSTTELRGRVVEVRPETSRATTLRIRPGRGWRGHRAGQFVGVGLDVDGVRQWRTYSVTSPESTGGDFLEITVQAQPGGLVSPRLAHRTPVGTVLHLEPAAGDFVLPDPLPRRLLAVTAGSGITPIAAMARSLAARGPLPDLVVVHSAPSPAEMIFRDELRALAAAHPSMRLLERATRAEGRLRLADLDELCPDWRDRQAFVCGPSGLLDAAAAHWTDHPERLRTERFTPPPRAGGGRGGAVTYGTRTVAVDGARSLLEAGEEAGVSLPSGCRMGICFGCVVPLREGQVRDLRTGQLHGEPGDLVQTCINGASGAARLDVTS